MNSKDVQDRVNEFLHTMSTSRKMLRYAKKVFDYAVTSDHILIKSNPLNNIDMVKPKQAPKREHRYYTEEQAKLFEQGINEYCDHHYKSILAYTILLRTGIRTGELLGLQWSNVDLNKRTLLLNGRISHDGKGSPMYLNGLKNGADWRTVDLDGHTVDVLRHWRKQQVEASLKRGDPLTDDTFIVDMRRTSLANALYQFTTWMQAKNGDGFPKMNIHGLRHTHATLLISNNVEMKHVSDRLGHSDMMTTANIYAEVTPKRKKAVAELFSKIIE